MRHNFKIGNKILCKRTLTIGDPYWYDQNGNGPFPREHRMLVAGVWYDIIYNENDTENTFTVLDQQGNPHLHYVYSEEEKKNWPGICTDYGPRDYAKWFYTAEEMGPLGPIKHIKKLEI